MRKAPLIAAGIVAAGLVVVVGASAGGGSGGPDAAAGTTTTTFFRADEYEPDDARFQFGQEAVIVDGEVHPQQLEADIALDVLITNSTDEPVTVQFTNGGVGPNSDVTSAEIESGESYVLNETYVHSIYFTVNNDATWAGNIHVDYPRFGEEG